MLSCLFYCLLVWLLGWVGSWLVGRWFWGVGGWEILSSARSTFQAAHQTAIAHLETPHQDTWELLSCFFCWPLPSSMTSKGVV